MSRCVPKRNFPNKSGKSHLKRLLVLALPSCSPVPRVPVLPGHSQEDERRGTSVLGLPQDSGQGEKQERCAPLLKGCWPEGQGCQKSPPWERTREATSLYYGEMEAQNRKEAPQEANLPDVVARPKVPSKSLGHRYSRSACQPDGGETRGPRTTCQLRLGSPATHTQQTLPAAQ